MLDLFSIEELVDSVHSVIFPSNHGNIDLTILTKMHQTSNSNFAKKCSEKWF